MSVTKSAFSPPNSAGAIIHIFSYWFYVKCIPYLVFYPYNNASPCSYISESRPQGHRTARLNYWVTDSSFWVSLKQCKRKKSRSYHLITFVPRYQLLTPSPCLTQAPRLPMERGRSAWGTSLLCSSLHWLRTESPLSISPKLSLHVFHSASVDREGQDFGWQQFLLFNEKI